MMKWTVKAASGESFVDSGDTFSANGAGGEPHLDATCQNPANTVLWESAVIQETSNGYKGKMVNGFVFIITISGNNVQCELISPVATEDGDSSGTWTGDEGIH